MRTATVLQFAFIYVCVHTNMREQKSALLQTVFSLIFHKCCTTAQTDPMHTCIMAVRGNTFMVDSAFFLFMLENC